MKRALPCGFTKEQWAECQNHFNNKCAYCGREEKLTQDHFVPLSNGGEYTKNNIIPACHSCNASKSNADFFEWYQRNEYYSEVRKKKILKYLNYSTGKTQQLALL